MRADTTLEPFRSRHAYSFAESIHAEVFGHGDSDEDTFPDFFDHPEKVFLPHKDTLLHDVIRSVLNFQFDYSTGHYPDPVFYRSVLLDAGVKAPSWLVEEKVEGHIAQLDRLLKKAIEIITPSIFHLLFSDRLFLITFQSRVAEFVRTLKHEDYPQFFNKAGKIRRPRNVPSWLKAGVFHRDRGRCQQCFKDLTGLGRPVRDLHIDHIVPLAESGSNDPTNFQLLCASCNIGKGAKNLNEKPKFSPYW